MNCKSVREKIHDYLDSRLVPWEVSEMETHLSECTLCREMHQEFSSIQEMLSTRIKVPEPRSTRCLKRIRRKRFWSEPLETLCQLASDFRSFLRDLNQAAVGARLAALPLTICCFVVLISQFPVLSFDSVRFPALSMKGWTPSAEITPISTKTFATRQGQTRFGELMDAAFRLPYEDSLSLVAEITLEGHARIGGVLEYPKSDELFNAADLALRSTQFVADDQSLRPYVIFSFQKIDVWEKSKYPRVVR